MDNKILVADYMDENPTTVVDGSPLTTAIDVLAGHHLTGCPVVDAQKQVIGFISEQDCMRQLLVSSYHCSLEPSVNEVMQSEVLTITPHDTVISVAEMMTSKKPKLYPVVDDGKLVGLLSRAMVLQALKENESLCHRHA